MRYLALVLPLLLCGLASAGAEEPIVADLSKHLIAITTGFAGADVLLFGAVDGAKGAGAKGAGGGEAGAAGGAGEDVVVVVRGPERDEVLRRKARHFGIWLNESDAIIHEVPSFYWVAANRRLEDIAPPRLLGRNQIGVDHLGLHVTLHRDDETEEDYLAALTRLKVGAGLFPAQPGTISFLNGRLFRSEIHFPANVPEGIYRVEVYLMRGGEMVGAQTTPLVVSKTGLSADLNDFAHQQALVYGILAVLVAAFAGWAAAGAFRRS